MLGKKLLPSWVKWKKKKKKKGNGGVERKGRDIFFCMFGYEGRKGRENIQIMGIQVSNITTLTLRPKSLLAQLGSPSCSNGNLQSSNPPSNESVCCI